MRWSRDVTPELLRHVQHRYEETDEPVASIATEAGVREWVAQYGWRRRRDRPPLELPPEVRLTLDIDRALEEAESTSPLQGEVQAERPCVPPTGDSNPDKAPPAPPDALSLAERLERQLEQNLARVERMREMQWPQGPADAERTTRVLERMTQALLKVRQLRTPDPNKAATTVDAHDFDIPADTDEFRRRLARRIDAFVRSWTDAGVPGPGEASGAG